MAILRKIIDIVEDREIKLLLSITLSTLAIGTIIYSFNLKKKV